MRSSFSSFRALYLKTSGRKLLWNNNDWITLIYLLFFLFSVRWNILILWKQCSCQGLKLIHIMQNKIKLCFISVNPSGWGTRSNERRRRLGQWNASLRFYATLAYISLLAPMYKHKNDPWEWRQTPTVYRRQFGVAVKQHSSNALTIHKPSCPTDPERYIWFK